MKDRSKLNDQEKQIIRLYEEKELGITDIHRFSSLPVKYVREVVHKYCEIRKLGWAYRNRGGNLLWG